jgi:hypothetical protein
MPDTNDEVAANRELMFSLGHAIMQWAAVELNLSALFFGLLGPPYEAGELLWNRVRSFEAKLQMLHDLATIKFTDPEHRRNWALLREHTARLYGKRNQLAHSTLVVLPDDGKIALAPFATVSKLTAAPLRQPDIEDYTSEFIDIGAAINQFMHAALGASLHPISQELESDLLDHLREEDDRKREAQQHRSLAWRQYLERNPDLDLE